jgi:hypothetical protein
VAFISTNRPGSWNQQDLEAIADEYSPVYWTSNPQLGREIFFRLHKQGKIGLLADGISAKMLVQQGQGVIWYHKWWNNQITLNEDPIPATF